MTKTAGIPNTQAEEASSMTRRTFIKTGATMTGAAVAVGTAGTVASGLLFPQTNGTVVFPDSTCGSGSGHRVLVGYASKFGTTGEVAEAIARTLCRGGAMADTMPIADVGDLSVYDAAIIGGAIHYDNWMSEARDFVTANEDVLRTVPVAYFFTCGALAERSQKAENKARGYAAKLEALSDHISPVSIGRFAGVLDYKRMNLRTRIALRIIFTVMGAREGDYRDWDGIHSWANRVLELTRGVDAAVTPLDVQS